MNGAQLQDAVNPLAQTPADFKASLIALIPHLRGFATVLCRNRELAEDMAQEALVKAWRAQNSFEPGSNLKAWLFTILRNEFMTYRRRAWRQVVWDEDAFASRHVDCEQHWSSELADVGRALGQLSTEQREALILITVGHFSYEEAARISNCSVGTVKSRVFRARAALVTLLEEGKALPQGPPSSEGSGFARVLAFLPSTLSAHEDQTSSPLVAGG